MEGNFYNNQEGHGQNGFTQPNLQKNQQGFQQNQQGFQQNQQFGYQNPNGFQQNQQGFQQNPNGFQQNQQFGYQNPNGFQQNYPGYQGNAQFKKPSAAPKIILILVIVAILVAVVVGVGKLIGLVKEQVNAPYTISIENHKTKEGSSVNSSNSYSGAVKEGYTFGKNANKEYILKVVSLEETYAIVEVWDGSSYYETTMNYGEEYIANIHDLDGKDNELTVTIVSKNPVSNGNSKNDSIIEDTTPNIIEKVEPENKPSTSSTVLDTPNVTTGSLDNINKRLIIDGVTYELDTSTVGDLINNGWDIFNYSYTENKLTPEYQVTPGDYDYMYLTKDIYGSSGYDTFMLDINYENTDSNNYIRLEDAILKQFNIRIYSGDELYSGYPDVYLSTGVGIGSKATSIIEAYGNPTETFDIDDMRTGYTYVKSNYDTGEYINIDFDIDKSNNEIIGIRIYSY